MEFIDKVREHAKRVTEQKNIVQTEQAAKTSLILPFLQMLGYDVFNAAQVIPEQIADWAEKKGEKVDYTVKVGDKTVMLIECKQAGDPLDATKENQLANYFHHLQDCNVGVLTNGVVYKFYTDLSAENIMDAEPFFVFDFSTFKEWQVKRLEMFSKENIVKTDEINSDIVKTRNYVAVSRFLRKELSEPSDEFIKLAIKQMPFIKRTNEAVMAEFKDHVKKAFAQNQQDYFDAQIFRLKEAQQAEQEQKPAEPVPAKPAFVTTIEELQALAIVKSMLYNTVASEKIAMRDSENYCDILTSNTRIVRLFFNDPTMLQISFPTNPEYDKLGKIDIKSVEKLNEHGDKIISTAKMILASKEKPVQPSPEQQ
jgi:hypothetical protein